MEVYQTRLYAIARADLHISIRRVSDQLVWPVREHRKLKGKRDPSSLMMAQSGSFKPGPYFPNKAELTHNASHPTRCGYSEKVCPQKCPPSMKPESCDPSNSQPEGITDAYGIQAFLTCLHLAQRNPAIRLMAIGAEPTEFVPNYNSTEQLHKTFGGPMATVTLWPQEIEANVPDEYRVNELMKEIPPLRCEKYCLDTLFFLFYTNGGSVTQLLAAKELNARGWRFHRQQQLWVKPDVKGHLEPGTHLIFDPIQWRQVTQTCYLSSDELETKVTEISLPTGL
ncbi:CCR4-NOT transcription complex subunit 2-like [Tropilaelaps mercedesae]|uniref:CCR4-NOT transcription complex subunit 2-like n=1 Tax=Tropilaelaps mercedesae TaxID=418985 RepID=A0A1V9X315_9ACAR|nr:CCR4-NOT transcription complex subunit 2-like [Tropilaelaps mercedesae]